MFKKIVEAKYTVVAYERELSRRIDETERELGKIEDELKSLREEYDKLLKADETDENQKLLEELDQKIEDCEEERKKAERDYEEVLHTTVQDLKDEYAYQQWKDER
jgi:chromosome segregation ATPase